MEDKHERLIIIGSGPAGLTAAIYAARGGLEPIVISGKAPGGQLMLTTDVDDFPGFPGGIQGAELMGKLRTQAERFKTRFIDEDVVSVNFRKKPFRINTHTQYFFTDAVIIATGASAKWLGLESEYNLIGRGVSACAVCDGLFFRGKNVIVVGGGDAAMREAQHLSKTAKQVTVVHRRDKLRAQNALYNLVKSKQNIDFVYNKEIVNVLGQDKVIGVMLKDTQTGVISKKGIDGVFVAIGHNPSTKFLDGQLQLDERGYLTVKDETKTSIEGIFAAGDVSDHRYRQAVTAAGAGCKAALDAEEYLEMIHLSKS